jgi:predicted tellurium resistance membrane protein TerC
MGLDNVLAVAGAAHGSYLLVILGLLISVPIVVWGSTVVLRLLERYPRLIYVGSGVLAWTAGKMIADEKLFHEVFAQADWLKYAFAAVVVAGVLLVGKWAKNRGKETANAG